MTQPESVIQATFHRHLSLYGGSLVVGFSVPNERKASKSETGRLKAQGLVKGACDYVVLWPEGGALIEFKTPTGRVQPEQEDFGNRATSIGWPYRVCRSWQEAFAFIEQAGAPLQRVLREEPYERFVLAEKAGV